MMITGLQNIRLQATCDPDFEYFFLASSSAELAYFGPRFFDIFHINFHLLENHKNAIIYVACIIISTTKCCIPKFDSIFCPNIKIVQNIEACIMFKPKQMPEK